MSSGTSDRNLLVGVLAYQNGLIRREQLLEAMNSWLINKKTPLEDILFRQGALDDEHKRLLLVLVGKHLAFHDNDAHRSLQAVSSIGSLDEELRSLSDPDVNHSLQKMGTARADEYVTIPTPPVTAVGRPGERFRIVRPHGKGGLGQVSVALDTELNREVALKEIQSPFADFPQSRARFLLEAEITGRLEHPGVVPIYGLGSYSDGRPYYAMRFIRGDSLKEALESFHQAEPAKNPAQRLLELRKLLRRFVDVCNAIEYAHSRGVLHRDLKPANVMLGRYGETLVVDWGVAKAMGKKDIASEESTLIPALGSGSAPTQLGWALGTPPYMSPEQAAGRVAELGPASDVYSLGATLYHVLSGKAPYKSDTGDQGEVLRKVQRGDFPPPRAHNKDIPKPLEAICVKAMALNPEDRYPSAACLANDIESWLADAPVYALPDGIAQAAFRWLRHNWAWAFSAAAAILIVAIVSIVAGAVINGQKKDILVAKENAEAAAASEAAAKQQARKAIDNYVWTVRESLKEEHFQPLRMKLLADARGYYQEFVENNLYNEAEQLEVANDLVKVAAINESTGSIEEALKSYNAAIAIQQKLTQADPSFAEYQSKLAGLYNAVGQVHRTMGMTSEALKAFQRALDIQRKLVRDPAEIRNYRKQLANTLNNRNAAHHGNGSRPQALKEFGEALALYRDLSLREPDNADYDFYTANIYNNLGKLQWDDGSLEAAMLSFREALRIAESLTDSQLPASECQSLLAVVLSSIAGLHQCNGNIEEALHFYDTALNIQEKLCQENPLVHDYQNDLATTYNNLGTVHGEAHPDKALKSFLAALALRLTLAKENPLIADYQVRLVKNHLNVAKMRMKSGAWAMASESAAEAESVANQLRERFPDQKDYDKLWSDCAECRKSIVDKKSAMPESALRTSDKAAESVRDAP